MVPPLPPFKVKFGTLNGGSGFKVAICDLEEVWKSQFATSKHKYYLIAIFKSLPFILAMTMLSFGLAK